MRLHALLPTVAVAICVAVPSRAQMVHMGQMGGSSFMVNVVSPASSPIQIGRGTLMIRQGMASMTGMSGGMPTMTPSPGAKSQGVQMRLMLAGVNRGGAPMTASGNRLQVSGTLSSSDGSVELITVDQLFDMTNGVVLLSAPVNMPDVTATAVFEINDIVILDPAGNTFGITGFRISAPVASQTPSMMPTPTMMRGMH